MLYLDASALVKLYADERGTFETLELVDAADIVGTSSIARVEVASALARASRTGMLAAAAGRGAFESFDAESSALVQVPVSAQVLTRAQDAVWRYGLRNCDAVHLASALVWKEQMRGVVTLATFDTLLARAAATADLDVWPERSA